MKPAEYRPTMDEELTFEDGTAQEIAAILQRFEPGEFYRKGFSVEPAAVRYMNAYVDALARGGLDIGKGDSAFGYRMPLPEERAVFRNLIIFRRK